jgi:outer membrane protein assembly factor BamB
MKTLRLVLAIGLCGMSACASVKDTVSSIIAKETDNSIPPAELVEFEATAEVERIWSDRYGKGVENLFIQLIPAPYGDRIFTADRDGRVIALDSQTGDEIWSEREKHLRISGGPGVGDGNVYVGTSDAEVVAFDAESGERKWLTTVSSEVLAPPRSAGGTVVVRTGDGKLFGLFAETGKRKWVYDRTIPVLTLRGTGAPVIFAGSVIAGFDNGRLVALDLATGKQQWETRLAVPSGRSDLERMVDVDAEPTIFEDTAYVATFQASVAAVSLTSGQLEWSREISSYSNVAADDDRVYVTDALGYVWGLERSSGTSIWKQQALKARQLSGPTVIGDYVVIGDLEGYLHWLDRETGDFVYRTRLDDTRILVPGKTVGDILLAFSSSGVLAAYRPGRKSIAQQSDDL